MRVDAMPSGEAGPLEKNLFGAALPEGLTVAWAAIPALQKPLFCEEWVMVGSSAPKRQREFIAGRVLARQMQERRGFAVSPLINGGDRAPRWPTAVCGSISHTNDICGVAIGARRHIRSVGLDIETVGRVTPQLWPQVFTDREILNLRALGETARAIAATSLFCAKESFYKLQYPLTGQWVGFQDAEVELLDDREFTIAISKALPGMTDCYRGSFDRPTDDTVASLLVLPV
ncbi:MAG: 4'-phosphopantetheinyl transferase [Congregibacter sp.]